MNRCRIQRIKIRMAKIMEIKRTGNKIEIKTKRMINNRMMRNKRKRRENRMKKC